LSADRGRSLLASIRDEGRPVPAAPRTLVTAVRLGVLVASLLVVQGCGSSGDSSEPAQVSVPSITAPSIPQSGEATTTTDAQVAPKPSPKPAQADNPESGTPAATDQDNAKRGGSGGSAGGKSNAAEDTKRAGSGASSGTSESAAQSESNAKSDQQRAGG
jgi:hypothetical protein